MEKFTLKIPHKFGCANCRGGWGFLIGFFADFLSYRLYYFAEVY